MLNLATDRMAVGATQLFAGTAADWGLLTGQQRQIGAGVVNISDSKPFQVFQIEVDNSSGTPANVTAFQVLMNSN